jgi:hypothetical protein
MNPSVSKFVGDAVLDGLELDASHRPRTVDEFVERLGLGVPPEARAAQPQPTFTAPVPLPPLPQPLPPPPARTAGGAKVVAPAVAATAAFGAIIPVAAFALLALVILPAIATAGDAMVFVRMRRLGDRLHWRHRAALPPYVPMRFLRNVGKVFYSGVPALLVAGVTVALALLLDSLTSTFTAESWVLRVGGATSAVLLAVPVFRDRVKYRAAVVGDRLLGLSLDNGALTSFGLAVWIVTALMVAIAVGLRPDPWPFGG